MWYQVVRCQVYVNMAKTDIKEWHAEDSPGINDKQKDEEEH